MLLERPLYQRCFTEQDYGVLIDRYGAMEQSQLIEVVRAAISRLSNQLKQDNPTSTVYPADNNERHNAPKRQEYL